MNHARPDGVTILLGGSFNSTEEVVDDRDRTSCVPVEYPEKPVVKRDFAICVQVSLRSAFAATFFTTNS